QTCEEFFNSLLPFHSSGDLLQSLFFFFLRTRRDFLEAGFIVESRNTVRRNLEVQLQRALDCDLAITKVAGRINLRELAFLEVAQELDNLLRAFGRNLTSLVA